MHANATTRRRLLLKANADLRDALVRRSRNGEIQWNGIREVTSERIYVRHETHPGSPVVAQEAINQSWSFKPIGVLEQGPYALDAQLHTELYSDANDAVLLAVQPDIFNCFARHRSTGHLVFPADFHDWPAESKSSFQHDFEISRVRLTPDETFEQLSRIVGRMRSYRQDVVILVANMPLWSPFGNVHSYVGVEDDIVERMTKFNLALYRLSREEDISILDLARIVAENGANTVLEQTTTSFSLRGCELVAKEVVRILEDEGVFD